MRRTSETPRAGTAETFFDAHCDAVMKSIDEGADFQSTASPAHISLPRLLSANVRVQAFACCVVYPDRPSEAYAERGWAMVEAIAAMAAESGGRMAVARTAADLERSFLGGPISAVIGLEGADPLEGHAENLRGFADHGVRQLIFAWKDNAFCGTAFGSDAPLSREGDRLLGLSEELRVMVDVSHLSDRAFDGVCERSSRPFIASHSNCRAVCPHPRNLTDAMIRRLADRGGVMGINLAPHFLDPAYSAAWVSARRGAVPHPMSPAERAELAAERSSIPAPGLDAVVTHVLHAMQVGGEDVVGLGGDLDGIERLPVGIETVADYPKLVPLFRAAGLSDRQIDKVCHGNFRRVFAEVLP
ncbi:MAG: membrane dipeptidase [Candidatus Bipolaricaulis sp.]|nr:membrane dipeptidase [Candidatus Bipolaricaulis sp.]